MIRVEGCASPGTCSSAGGRVRGEQNGAFASEIWIGVVEMKVGQKSGVVDICSFVDGRGSHQISALLLPRRIQPVPGARPALNRVGINGGVFGRSRCHRTHCLIDPLAAYFSPAAPTRAPSPCPFFSPSDKAFLPHRPLLQRHNISLSCSAPRCSPSRAGPSSVSRRNRLPC